MGFKSTLFSKNESDYRYIYRNYKKLVTYIDNEEFQSKGDTIWAIWWQGADAVKPKLVQKCLDSINSNKGKFKFVIIDKNNYSKYIDIANVILEKFENGTIGIAAFTDYIRFSLLKKYGGWYVDATIFANRCFEVPVNNFYTIRLQYDKEIISKARWCAFCWYLPPKHGLTEFFVRAFEEYWRNHDELINYFLVDCLVRVFYSRSHSFKHQIDSLMSDCPNLFFLQSLNCQHRYNEDRWFFLKENNRFFKCNRKINLYKQGSYYNKIMGL
ncbi:MAG: capsular polysaccharide synthesis protein [Lachnospiraceae bacterium]